MPVSERPQYPRRAVGLTATAAAAALLSPLFSPTAHAVVGTPTPEGTHAFTAQLDIGDGTRSCSAALIAPEWLVTAASCFAEDPQSGTAPAAGRPTLKTVATVGRNDLNATTGGHIAEVTQIVPRAGRDLAFARLATPATGITPVKLAATAPAAGDDLTVLGYGRTATEWVPGRLNQANYTVDSSAADTLTMTGKTAADSVCKGDTGGPVLRTTGSGSYELVAVNHRSWQGGCHGSTETRTTAVAARADASPTGTSLAPGQTLRPGDSLLSRSAKVTLTTDGNLTVTSNAGTTLWSTGTSGNPGATATFTTGGALTVVSATGSTLWSSKTTAAGGTLALRDHGDLVIRSSTGASLWSTNTTVRGDLTGDGRSDFALWYDFANGTDAINTFTTAADGTFQAPRNSWRTATDTWDASRSQPLSGDFNGDGLADVAALYSYPDGSIGTWTWLAKGDGSYATPFASYRNTPGHWTATRSHAVSGDFNGDGRDDIATWYDYADGSDKLWTFTSRPDGGFNAPTTSWSTPAGGWDYKRQQMSTGDFNGDGRDDLGVFYVKADGSARIWSFRADTKGGFTAPVAGWTGPTWGSLDRTTLLAGDFDGDGRDDLSAWYDHTDGSDAIHTFPADADGIFRTHKASEKIATGITRSRMKLATGDFNGDGRDDHGFLYDNGDGTIRMWTKPALADGTFGPHVRSWTSTGTTWTFGRTQPIDRHPTR
ncbi:FG-GAP-like repeat-containing protein [Streptomyces parvus]|uniref:FG-GAP-like repeat-containing protein n=1 Tax=Streptomyces parvus TaxID=66428 RepID=UPI003633039E